MNLFINKVISSILQIILFAIIPFIWWCITARKQQSFTNTAFPEELLFIGFLLKRLSNKFGFHVANVYGVCQ